MTADPVILLRATAGATEVRGPCPGPGPGQDDAEWRPRPGTTLEVARELLGSLAREPVPGLPPFQGGLAGYLGYEVAAQLERVSPAGPRDLELPDAFLALYDWVIAWDHEAGRAWIVSTGAPLDGADDTGGAETAERARRRSAMVEERLRRDRIPTPRPGTSFGGRAEHGAVHRVPVGEVDSEAAGLHSTFAPDEYRAAVARIRQDILAGEIFQANLSQRFDSPLASSPFAVYRRLRGQNPAPFGAYLELDRAAVLSVSPERFLRFDPATRAVETRPIKGTRPRAREGARDESLARDLVASAKDRSENVMIVDLMRNDLSRECVHGSIRVPSLCALESHPTVHHLVSTVTGRLRPRADAVSLLEAAFPGGSITGAPKIRAMEIIAELEPVARGVYCGSIGYLGLSGAMDTSIAIRTAVAHGGRLYFSAGGGIVAESDPAEEYRETLHKARAFFRLLAKSARREKQPS